jgi:hypothetical protein
LVTAALSSFVEKAAHDPKGGFRPAVLSNAKRRVRKCASPIPLPDGGDLRTLRDAGNFIAGLSKRQHETFAWRAAIKALMLVVGRRARRRHSTAQGRDHAGVVSRRDGADAAQEAGEEISDRAVMKVGPSGALKSGRPLPTTSIALPIEQRP